jgi:benzoyl-CoA reductase subunit C
MVIQEFRNAFERRHDLCMSMKREGKGIIGCFYGAVPKEVIHAAGLIPVQLLEDRTERFEEHSGLLPFLCGMSKNVAGQIYQGKYSYLDGIVVGTVCDTNRHVFDIWVYRKVAPFLRLLRTPAKADREALEFYAKDLRKLASELGRISGVEANGDRLRQSVELFNENRVLVEEFQSRRESMGINAREGIFVVASSLILPVERHTQLLRTLLSEERPPEAPQEDKPRVYISALNFNMALDLVSLVERYGGEVAGFDLHQSARYACDPIPLDDEDPFLCVAKGYLRRVPIPGVYEFEKRAEALKRELERTEARGIIFLSQLYCDAYAMEHAILMEKMNRWGIPYLKLEAEDSPGSLEQLNVRVQSFIESLS